jgi:hypothetical protein
VKKFIEFIVRQLVDEPDQVIVEEINNNKNTVDIKIEVAKNDIGKVIGKQGKNINSIRTLLTAVGAKNKKRTLIQVIE